jgi:hypothetical protein
MRVLVLLLLLANVAFFAWTTLAPGASSGEAYLVQQQINPERIRVLSPREAGEMAAGKGASTPLAAAPAPATAPAPVAAVAPAAAAAAPVPPASTKLAACVEWGPFSATDSARVESALEPLALGAKLVMRRTEENAGWWVFMPPQGSRQAAVQKTGELKRFGVDEFFIVQEEGKWRFAISLGVFKTEEAARAKLAELRGKNVRSAQVGPRDAVVTRVSYQLRDLGEQAAGRFAEVRKGFAAVELKECGAVAAAPGAASALATPPAPALTAKQGPAKQAEAK